MSKWVQQQTNSDLRVTGLIAWATDTQPRREPLLRSSRRRQLPTVRQPLFTLTYSCAVVTIIKTWLHRRYKIQVKISPRLFIFSEVFKKCTKQVFILLFFIHVFLFFCFNFLHGEQLAALELMQKVCFCLNVKLVIRLLKNAWKSI